ncbi:MAG TPA: chromosomal replication initiator protein DnaA, partial [Hellea balneolensis]|nr:chromosomal replication initiator protein DnaA [Hellea balneolensis]
TAKTVKTSKPVTSVVAPPFETKAASPTQEKPSKMTSRFTFANFVVGASNELAVAGAKKFANSRDTQYNPMVIHGPNGMGKTHLLYAVMNHIAAHDPTRRVQFVPAEQFVASFVRSVRANGRTEIENFKTGLRNVDLLIIDDAHFITDKPGSQEELLHTLIALVENGKQVILATDRHPHTIENAEERLKSYLCGGLVCDIGPADYELRLRILDRLVERRRKNGNPALEIPQTVRDMLAARINATPRDLEGVFNQVVARLEFLGRAVTLESVEEALAQSRFTKGARPTVERIQRVIAKYYGVSLDELLSKRRARAIARPRQIAMYLCKNLTTRSLPDIGRRFGGRDHTTVIHAIRRVESLCDEDETLNAEVKSLAEQLQNLAPAAH